MGRGIDMKRLKLTFEQLEDRRMLSGTHFVLHDMDVVWGPESDQQYVWTEGMPEDQFTYPSPAGPVEVTILSAQSPDYTVDEDGVLVVEAAEGVSGGLPGVELIAGPTHGVMVLDGDGSFIYAPKADYSGEDHFIWERDGIAALTTLLVIGVNDNPVATDDSYLALEDVQLVLPSSVLLNDDDVDGDPLTIDSYSQPANGEVTYEGGGIFAYTPDADFNGVDEFTYVIEDGQGGTDSATVTIDVAAVNDAPVGVPDSFTTQTGKALGVTSANGPLSNDTDPDGDPLLGFVVVSQPNQGEVSATTEGAFLYVPRQGFVGEDAFTYVASDGVAASGLTTVTITVTDSDSPYLRSEVYISTPAGITISVDAGLLANDHANGNDLVATLITHPVHGVLSLAADGSFTYTPEADFLGADPFTYAAGDVEIQSAIWVQLPPTPASSATGDEQGSGQSRRRPEVAGLSPSLYDVVAFSQNEQRKREWLSPPAVDLILQQGG